MDMLIKYIFASSPRKRKKVNLKKKERNHIGVMINGDMIYRGNVPAKGEKKQNRKSSNPTQHNTAHHPTKLNLIQVFFRVKS